MEIQFFLSFIASRLLFERYLQSRQASHFGLFSVALGSAFEQFICQAPRCPREGGGTSASTVVRPHARAVGEFTMRWAAQRSWSTFARILEGRRCVDN